MQKITEPGLYDMDPEDYHADPCPVPSLSSGIARRLLDASPRHAWTAHPRLNPEHEPTERGIFDFGSAAHRLLLGKGRDISVVEADDWRTKAAKELRDDARAAGRTPVLAKDYERAVTMVRAARPQIKAIPTLARAFGDEGKSEVVIAGTEAGVWYRGMADRLLIDGADVIMCDYKTTGASAHPAAVSRRLFDAGYDFQAGFYRRLLALIRPEAHRFRFVLVTQENEPPFALSAVELDHASWILAEKRVRAALGLWKRCVESDDWPCYPAAIATAELPGFIESAWLDREVNDEQLAGVGRGFATLTEVHGREPQPIFGAI
jgi:hypothetical protein